jgi:hypothetical protein
MLKFIALVLVGMMAVGFAVQALATNVVAAASAVQSTPALTVLLRALGAQ